MWCPALLNFRSKFAVLHEIRSSDGVSIFRLARLVQRRIITSFQVSIICKPSSHDRSTSTGCRSMYPIPAAPHNDCVPAQPSRRVLLPSVPEKYPVCTICRVLQYTRTSRPLCRYTLLLYIAALPCGSAYFSCVASIWTRRSLASFLTASGRKYSSLPATHSIPGTCIPGNSKLHKSKALVPRLLRHPLKTQSTVPLCV